MDSGGASDDADCHGHLQCTDQVSLGVAAPGAQGGVATAAGGVGVRPGFDGAPVVARGDDHRVDAVHDAFIMRGGAVRVSGGKRPGGDDPVAHCLGAEVIECQLSQWDGAARPRQTAVSQVREDAQVHPPAGDGFNQRGEALDCRVDGVGTHGIAHVIDQV